jgi:hypothetical protein
MTLLVMSVLLVIAAFSILINTVKIILLRNRVDRIESWARSRRWPLP